MHPKHPHFRALILAGLMGWTILEVSSSLSSLTKKTENSLPLPIPLMNSSAVAQEEARALPKRNPRMAGSHGHLPLTFEVNQGQTDPQVQFFSRGRGATFFLTKTEAVLQFRTTDFGLRNSQLSIDDFPLSILDRTL